MSSRTITTLGAVAEIITGPFGSMLHQSDYTPTGIPVIMPQDIGNRTLDKSAIAHVGSSDAERLSRYKVKENDIVYARRGDVEKHAFICKDDIGALCGTGCMRVRVDAQKAIPMYISFYLNRPESKRWISQHAVGSNMPNLNTEILNEVPLELPSIDEQLKTITILNSTVAESKEASKVIPFTPKSDNDQRFAAWMQNQGVAARGDIDMQTMREIFDAMDDDDK